MAGRIEIALASKRHPPLDPILAEQLVGIFAEGPQSWNAWRRRNPEAYIDLRGLNVADRVGLEADYSGADLNNANLSKSNFSTLNLSGANLAACYADDSQFETTAFDGADLRGAFFNDCGFHLASFEASDLRGAALQSCSTLLSSFDGANLRRADLRSSELHSTTFKASILAEARLSDSVLRDCSFQQANLEGADLTGASLVQCDLGGARLDRARVYGTSVWDCVLDGTSQKDLLISKEREADLTVDDLRVAQFIYLILNNTEIRHLIDNITAKVVLILGNFSPEQKPVLDKIKGRLRDLNYTPVLFDFQKPTSRNYIETVTTMANMARFVVADLTNYRIVLQEVEAILRNCHSTPVASIYQAGAKLPAAVVDFHDCRTFMAPIAYSSVENLLNALERLIVQPAEALAAAIIAGRENFARSIGK